MAEDDEAEKRQRKRRCITKLAAMKVCSSTLSQACRTVCLSHREIEFALPDGVEPEQLAEAVGGAVVGTAVRGGFLGLGKTKRVVTVRIAVGLLTSSMQANAAAARLPAAFQVTQLADAAVSVKGVAKVLAPVLDEAIKPKADLAKYQEPVHQQKTIKGEAKARGVSLSSAHFFLILDLIQVIQAMNKFQRGDDDLEQFQLSREVCCDVLGKAAEAAWKKAPEVFHENALLTTDHRPHHFKRKGRSRRN